MLFPTWRVKLLERKSLDYKACPNCRRTQALDVEISSIYFHVLYFPLFPIGKKVILECKLCEYRTKEKRIPEVLRYEVKRLKKEVKFPKRQFAGLILSIPILFYIVFLWIGINQKNEAYITKPMVNDTYHYKVKSKEYTIYKVLEVREDSLFLKRNMLTVPKIMRLSEIDFPENYSKEVERFSRKEIIEQYNTDQILSVYREKINKK